MIERSASKGPGLGSTLISEHKNELNFTRKVYGIDVTETMKQLYNLCTTASVVVVKLCMSSSVGRGECWER